MKKLLFILTLLLALVCVFAACDKEEAPNDGNHTHAFGEWKAILAATCSTKGEERRACACGESETRETDMIAHAYGEWSVTTTPFCGVEGIETHVCECGATETRPIPATGAHISSSACKCIICGEKVAYHRENDMIWFGEYPQTKKAESVTISETTDDRGYYLGSDNAYYAKVVADPCYDTYTFSDGTAVVEGQEYYFKVEPIRWQILSEAEGTALILCENVIANHAFDDNSNNYAESQIRAWLNDQFYHTAFSALEQELIQITSVDNSAESTGYPDNPYVCEDTEDKIFLLSIAEGMAFMESLGEDFLNKELMDYAFATGGYAFYRTGYWWLRSAPNNKGDDWGQLVGDPNKVDNACGGVAPLLRIKLA